MKQKYFYKVVNKGMTSYIVENHEDISVKYILNKWVKPKLEGSKLFVFRGLQAARDFGFFIGTTVQNARIYQCEVKNPEKCKIKIIDFFFMGPNIKDFWESDKRRNHCIDAPQGSYLVDAVKLIKQIKEEKNVKSI